MSGRTGRRFDDHAVKNWWPLVRTVTLEWHDTHAQAALAERRAIRTERPRYNRAGLQPPKRAPGKARGALPKAAEPEVKPVEPPRPRNLLEDLDMLLGNQRINTRDVAGMLRALAPEWEPYRKMNGARLRVELKRKGVRTINTSGRHYLDPTDLRRVRVGATSVGNSA